MSYAAIAEAIHVYIDTAAQASRTSEAGDAASPT